MMVMSLSGAATKRWILQRLHHIERCWHNSRCAAEAIFCCPTENSRHLEAQMESKDALFKNEKESARTMARCRVSLEKSSKNYIRCESEPSQAATHSVLPPHLLAKRRVMEGDFPHGEAKSAMKMRRGNSPWQVTTLRGEG
jgi:hypothetical protein